MFAYALAFLVAAAAPASTASSDREALVALERDWNRAVVEKDVAALERILAEDFTLVWVNGAVSGKADILKTVRERKATIDPFETEEVTVHLFQDGAVMSGIFSQTGRLGDESETIRIRYTDTYRRTPKGWQAVAAQATLVR